MKTQETAISLVRHCPKCGNEKSFHTLYYCSCGYMGCESLYNNQSSGCLCSPCSWCGSHEKPKPIAIVLARQGRKGSVVSGRLITDLLLLGITFFATSGTCHSEDAIEVNTKCVDAMWHMFQIVNEEEIERREQEREEQAREAVEQRRKELKESRRFERDNDYDYDGDYSQDDFT